MEVFVGAISRRRKATICAAAAAAAAAGLLTSGIVWSQHGQPATGPRIVFGEGHFNRAGKVPK